MTTFFCWFPIARVGNTSRSCCHRRNFPAKVLKRYQTQQGKQRHGRLLTSETSCWIHVVQFPFTKVHYTSRVPPELPFSDRPQTRVHLHCNPASESKCIRKAIAPAFKCSISFRAGARNSFPDPILNQTWRGMPQVLAAAMQ